MLGIITTLTRRGKKMNFARRTKHLGRLTSIGRFIKMPERIPALVVPQDLENFELKPYVAHPIMSSVSEDKKKANK